MTFTSTHENNGSFMACLVSIKNVELLQGALALVAQISRNSFCVKLTNWLKYKTPAALHY